MTHPNIKYLVFCGPIGCGKTTQIGYLWSNNKHIRLMNDYISDPSISLSVKERGLPDLFAYNDTQEIDQLIYNYEQFHKKNGIVFVVFVPSKFEICRSRILKAQQLFGCQFNPRGLIEEDFNNAIDVYKNFKNLMVHKNMNIEFIEFVDRDSVIAINKKVLDSLSKYNLNLK
jgi:hypothetical protein